MTIDARRRRGRHRDRTSPASALRWLAACSLMALVAITVAADVRPGSASPAGTPLPVVDPARAPIVFIPGLLGSELGCGPVGSETEVWPGRSDDPAAWIAELWATHRFADLALVNVPGPGGAIETRTTSSSDWPLGCGTTSFGAGTAAAHEPRALRPLWCLPELLAADLPRSCPRGHSTSYATFGVRLQQAAAAGRGQEVVWFPWDWRRSPADQVDELEALLDEVTTRSGVRATVVAHSFGNLMFREWVRSQGDRAGDRVGRFLGIAAPWWGVATGWTHPAYGQLQPGVAGEVLSLIAHPDDVKTVFQSMPGTYWLLPGPAYVDTVGPDGAWLARPVGGDPGASQWVEPSATGPYVGTRFASCPQPTAFPCQSEALYDLAAGGAPPVGFDTGGIPEWVGLVGAGVETAGQICDGCTTWPDGRTDGTTSGTGDDLRTIRPTSGDENVPVFSAIQGTDPFDPPGEDVPFYFTCGVTHMGLMSVAPVLDRTIPYLVGDAPLPYDDVLTAVPCGSTPTTTTTTAAPPTTTPSATPDAVVTRPTFTG